MRYTVSANFKRLGFMTSDTFFPRLFYKKESPGSAEIRENLKKQVFEIRPLLRKLWEEHETQSLSSFVYGNVKSIVTPDESRQAELLGTLERLLQKRLGSSMAEEVTAQLKKYYMVSTADHHGPIVSPFSLNSNIVATSGYAQMDDPILKYMVVLSCANISLNNEDFPRGLMFHSYHHDKLELQRLSFLPSNSHSCVLYGFRPYMASEVLKVKKLLQEKVRNGLVPEAQSKVIFGLLETVYHRNDVVQSESYCEQITKTNVELWRSYFPQKDGQVPDLIYLEQEELVSQLLLEYHIGHDTLIHKMLFDPMIVGSLTEPLRDAMEPFLRQGFHGTDLFWGINDKHYRIKLQKKDNQLVSEDGSFTLTLDPESIAQALKERRIIPNLLVIFTVLVLYYQLNCLGGFNQMHYLDAMQKVYNESKLDSLRSRANTHIFNYGLQTLFLGHHETQSILAMGIDLMLYGSAENWGELQENLKQVELKGPLESLFLVLQDILS
jgi:hypothetical protein